jgi:hypothetical protein
VHQTGTPPQDSYACLQRCGLQAQSRVLLQCVSSCVREKHDLLLSPNSLRFAGSIQTSNSCSKCSSHLQIGRPSNTIIFHLPLARSLERVTELVYIIKRLRTENQSPHTGHHLPPRKLYTVRQWNTRCTKFEAGREVQGAANGSRICRHLSLFSGKLPQNICPPNFVGA